MKLTVVLADTHRTRCAVVFECEHLPYRRRTVQVELTPEQVRALRPHVVGISDGKDVYEEVAGCWLEDAAGPVPLADPGYRGGGK